jgi:integrase/recombinase XerC
MSLNAPESPESDWQYAGENLRRRKSSGVYYIFAKRNGKQFRRSTKTSDKATAKRQATAFVAELDRLVNDEAAHVTFEQLAARWTQAEKHALKDSSAGRRAASVKAIAPFFLGLQIRNIHSSHCERWSIERGQSLAPATFVKELETMRGVFRYAMQNGLILHDPSAGIKRPRVQNKRPGVPTREQLQKIITAVRGEAQGKGADGADLVELLAYSGLRLDEARSLRWQDVNFSGGVFTVTGGERGTKNYEHRTVPLFDAVRELLEKVKRQRGQVAPGDIIIKTASARKCLATACRKLKFPNFHHHSLRHFFTSCAVESGVDIPTIANWLGHKDGGALLMKRYSHLRQAHSIEQAKRVTFSEANTSACLTTATGSHSQTVA